MFEPFCTYKPKLDENLPVYEYEETMTYYVYGEEAVILFLREYNEFKSIHKDVKEFRSIAMYSDEKKIIRPIVLENKRISEERPNFNNFITLKLICVAIGQVFKKRGIKNAYADIKPLRNNVGEVRSAVIEIRINS